MAKAKQQFLFVPFEPAVMDYQFCMWDARTRDAPYAVIIDAIATQKVGGGYHVPANVKHAKESVSHAAWELEQVQDQECFDAKNLLVSYSILRCLFALKCLERNSPVVCFYQPPPSVDALIASLKSTAEKNTRDELLYGIAEALLMFEAGILPNDERAAERLKQLRGMAWSSDVPGLMLFIDSIQEPIP